MFVHHKKQYGGSSKVTHTITIQSRNSIPRSVPKRIENVYLNKYTYLHVHSSAGHNDQKVEIAQMSINRQMDKKTVIHPYNGILFNYEKE